MSENIKEVSMSVERPNGNTWAPAIHISCSKCGYKGQPMMIPRTDPANPDSTTFELGCPSCESEDNVTERKG